MKNIVLILVLFLSLTVFAQRKYSTFHEQRRTLFELLPTSSQDIIFLGNSITNGGEWSELFNDCHVKNRGISGDISIGIYERLETIIKGKPAKIFLMIGINDIALGVEADSIIFNMNLIVDKIKSESPDTRIYLQSILPVSDEFNMFSGHSSRGHVVKEVNEQLKTLAVKKMVTYIDLYSSFINRETGKISSKYTNDGLHLLGEGYLLWRDIVWPYVKE